MLGSAPDGVGTRSILQRDDHIRDLISYIMLRAARGICLPNSTTLPHTSHNIFIRRTAADSPIFKSSKEQRDTINAIQPRKRTGDHRNYDSYEHGIGEDAEKKWNLSHPANQFIGDFTQPKYSRVFKDQNPKDYRRKFYCSICYDGHILDPMVSLDTSSSPPLSAAALITY